MVDIPTLNKSVNEFRATIKTNMQRSRDLQKEQLDKDNRLQQKIENVKGAIEENLKLNNKDAAKRQQQQLKTLEKALETRNEEKRYDAQRSETLRNILGVSTRRFNQQKQANEEAKLARERLDDLRKQLREKGILFKVTKNRITKIAIKDTPVKDLEKFYTGPTATALSSDAITTAKILTKFAKSHNKLKIIAGFMDGKVLEAEDVAKIATLPTLDEARAKIVGILSSPAQKIMSILLAPGSKIAILAHEKSKKG